MIAKELEDYTPFTDEEKNQLAEEHMRIVYYIANRYKFSHFDKEEVQGWGFVGLTKAINEYEENRSIPLASLAFPKVKAEIFTHFFKKDQPISQISLQKQVRIGKEGNETSIEGFIADESTLSISENEIYQMVFEAIFEEPLKNRKVVVDHLLNDLSRDELASSHELPKSAIARILGRGKSLIKNHLINNDVIFDFCNGTLSPDKPRGQSKYRKITNEDYGPIRYLRIHFPYFSSNDIAVILNVSAASVYALLNYPPAVYFKTRPNDSVKEKAVQYCEEKYPERMPGEVKVINKKSIAKAIK